MILFHAGFGFFCSPHTTEELFALMQSCWELEPKDRAAVSDLETSVNQVRNDQEGIMPQNYDYALYADGD